MTDKPSEAVVTEAMLCAGRKASFLRRRVTDDQTLNDVYLAMRSAEQPRPDSGGVSEAVEEAAVAYLRRRAKQEPSSGLRERRSISVDAVRYGQALLNACADEIEKRIDIGGAGDLPVCEICSRSIRCGQFINQYDDAVTVHCDCDSPFDWPTVPIPAPTDDGRMMPTYILAGNPLRNVPVSLRRASPDTPPVEQGAV